MKKIMKYQLRDMLIGYAVYAAVMILLTAVTISVSVINSNINLSVNGNGFSSVIFCFAGAIAMYKEQCQLAIQNSISRKDFFRSSFYVITILCLLCAFIDLVLRGISLGAALFSAETVNFDLSSFIFLFYPDFLETSSAATVTIAGFFISFLTCMLFAVLGFLIAGIYCRIPKKFRTFYCIALPVLFCGLTPAVSAIVLFSPGPLHNVMEPLVNLILSLDLMGTASGSPFRGMLTFTVLSLFMGWICYRILKKTEIA